ncbi:MAG: Outer membrane protein assembly factor BamB [Verrucomicrobia subdivision 3 bacterium]|nr:Outer membrane protein assembly factor BamB [Limisphaerales bacterium]MCS1413351.1 Outer membrane protein assembly factor BamB [Limisphaerales bacterium]
MLKNHMKRSLLLALAFSITNMLEAANWAQWRGPSFNGSTTETGLPAKWSKTENVVWKAKLPGESAATPAVWEDKVFVSSTDSQSQSLMALCFDRSSGNPLWSKQLSKGLRQDSRSSYSSPSPATDGQVVVFFYGNGDLIAFNLDGKELWKRNIQKEEGAFAFLWTFSSSPLLYEDKLYLQVLQRDTPVRGRGFSDRENESYILAMNPSTGKTLWRHVRPSKAKAESREAFTTPIPFEFRGQKQILIIGGDVLTGHDPATGKELWRWGTWNPNRIGHWRHVPSPIASEDIILVCAPKRDPIYAIKPGGAGLLNDRAIAWVSNDTRELSSDVPTPACYQGDFFILSDVRKALSRVEPKSGTVKWTTELPGFPKYEASPLAADGKIYVMNFAGDVVVINAEDGKIISNIAMGSGSDDQTRSAIIASHGQLFIRTNSELFCIAAQ